MASSSTPTSSLTTLTKKYEVFLSFRGEDTRYGFISHLYDALCRKKIETFIDDDKLERGEEISPALLKAIEGSKIAVVIFSKNYAFSKWCLRELAEIMKCKKLHELIVQPVFYHVDPSDVRKLNGGFKCSFANEEKELQEEVQKWREALTEASNIAGWDSSVIRTESKLVGDIVEDVWTKLMNKYISASSDFEGLIGIHKRIEQVMSLLCLDMEDVRIIGIWGMGGIGKTTIAQAVFNLISYKFNGVCFIEKVGKRLENDESNRLQLEVLSEVLCEENLKSRFLTIRPFMMEMLNQKKVFIVLDDVNVNVNKRSQLKTFVENLINRCGLGSRIIITSRDKQVLCNFNIDDHEIYEAEGFNNNEALELFRKYANPTEDCMALSKKIVNYAQGNPLALEVLGSSLKGKSKLEWKSALDSLQGNINSEIFDVLKISYDGLEKKERSLFLHIACFEHLYNGPRLNILDKYSLSVLNAKSLVTIGMVDMEEWVRMHDLLREMGREIVRRESPKKPGKRSRLWERDDVVRILKNNTGTDAVEGISLDMQNLEDIHLSSQVFDKMHNLRFLVFHSTGKMHFPNGLNCLPDELRILVWYGYPLRALPSNFNPKNLVQLDLSGSNIEQLWEGTKVAPKLKWLDLRYCKHLTRIPNLSDFPLLVEVHLMNCKSLVDFPSSVQQHNNLRKLNLSWTAIKEVPSSIQSLTNLTELDLSGCTWLKYISTSICKLKSLSSLKLSKFFEITSELLNWLQQLILSDCENLEMLPSSICNSRFKEDLYLSICSKLDKLPDNLGNLKSLKCLDVSGCAVGQLPSSITCLENLEDLDCSGCSLMEIPEDIGCLSSLKKLWLRRNMFESLPKSIKQLSKLEFLLLRDCKKLRSILDLPEGLKRLEATDCDQLCQVPDASEFVRCINSKSHDSTYYDGVQFMFANSFNLIKAVSNVFEESLRIMQHTEKGSRKPPNEFCIYLPGNKMPEWFSYQSLESSIDIQVLRNDLVNRKFMGFAICAVVGFDEYNSSREYLIHGVGCDFKVYYDHIEICNGNRFYQRLYDPYYLFNIFMDSDHMFLGYCSFYSRNPKKLPVGDSDYVDISIEFKTKNYDPCQLRCCAVHPIYAEEPIEIIGATIQEIGETSGRRSDRSDENDEEVEPHPKRICTQAIKTP